LGVFYFSLAYFVLVLFAFLALDFISSVLCEQIGWKESLPNDLFCRVGHKTLTQ